MALSSLQQRILTAAIIAPIFLAIMAVGGWIFALFITIVTLIGLRELSDLIAHDKSNSRHYSLYSLLGMGALILTAASLVYLRKTAVSIDHPGWLLLFMLMATVWATDICAYFTGRSIGGPKLAPSISPNKTWSGLCGGVIGASVILGCIAHTYHFEHWPIFAVFGIVLALVAQAGDLLESSLKRKAGVKDSGTLLPGHGGVLDRIDGLIFTAPLFVLFIWAVT